LAGAKGLSRTCSCAAPPTTTKDSEKIEQPKGFLFSNVYVDTRDICSQIDSIRCDRSQGYLLKIELLGYAERKN
ncbi:MAG TPA: hypothetical protein VGN21_11270, partial [Stellaceae bacterium]